jgi:hypothetical protein
MPNPNIIEAGKQTQFKPGQSGNPAGLKPGTRHISYWIQKGLETEMEVEDINGRKFKQMPIEAIVTVAIKKSNEGDQKWADWLAKYGYAQKVQLGNDPDNPLLSTQQLSDEELNARLKQIVAAGEGRSVGNPSGTRPKKS